MSTSRFDSGIQLLDKVVIQLNNLEKFSPIRDVSFVYFNCKSILQLEKLKKHPLVKNILVVSDMKFRSNKLLTISPSNWEKNKEELMKLTKNSFVIDEDRPMTPEEYYQTLQEFSQYYPMVLLFATQKLKKPDISKVGFSSYTEDTIYCNINKKIKEFGVYHFNSFSDLDSKIMEVSGLKSIRTGKNIFGKKSGPEVSLSGKTSPTRQEPEEATFDFLLGLPSPTGKPKLNKYKEPTSKQWLQEFYEYLRELLKRIFPEKKQNLIPKILTNDTIKNNWIPCFTHFTANPNPGKNYESVETIGDKTLGYCFRFYLKEREPMITEARLTNLDKEYFSTKFQSKVGKAMKLTDWTIICGINPERSNISEDLMEAFFGTIDLLLYKLCGTMGHGALVTYNFMKLVFDEIDFVEEEKKDTLDDKTYVSQFFKNQAFRIPAKFNYTLINKPSEIPDELWEKIVKDINKKIVPDGYNKVIINRDSKDAPGIETKVTGRPDGKTTVTVTILKEYAELARNYGIDIPAKDVVIGKAFSNIKKNAEKEAYRQAKDFMIEHGMTAGVRDTLKKEKKSAGLADLDMVYEKALQTYPLLSGEPYVTRGKNIKVSGQDVVVYQIIGEEESGRKISIFTLPSQDKAFEQGVIDAYLSS